MKKFKTNFFVFGAFTLAEIIIVIGIIGIIAEMTIPGLVQSYQETQMVTGLLKFHSTLQQAVQLWKQETSCYSSAHDCLEAQSADSNIPTDGWDQFIYTIGKHLKIVKFVREGNHNLDWLPNDTLSYYGNDSTAYTMFRVANHTVDMLGFALLEDGTTFTVYGEIPSHQFEVMVDVNGKKPPNRIGKDSFRMLIGGSNTYKRDINYCLWNGGGNGEGLCDCWSTCNPNNATPPRAMPTTYVLINHQLPDFKAIASAIGGGFKP